MFPPLSTKIAQFHKNCVARAKNTLDFLVPGTSCCTFGLFVCVNVLCPRQKHFSHARTCSCLSVFHQNKAEDKVSCSRTQHISPVSLELVTLDCGGSKVGTGFMGFSKLVLILWCSDVSFFKLCNFITE